MIGEKVVVRHCEGDSLKQSRKAPSLLERAGGEVSGLLRSARNDVLRICIGLSYNAN